MKITGLEKLSRDLKDAERAIAELDGNIGTVNFDPEHPGSIEAAIASVEQMLDERVGEQAKNPIVAPVLNEMKERYRQAILDRASEARLGGDAD